MIPTYLQVVNIMMHLDVPDRDVAIDQMVYLASRNNVIGDLDDLKTCLKVREAKRSTGFGKGVALPHVFSNKCKSIAISLAVLKNPIDWQSVDKKPVNVIALLVGPARMLHTYITLLSAISKVLADDSARSEILQQSNCQGIFDTIVRYDKQLNQAK